MVSARDDDATHIGAHPHWQVIGIQPVTLVRLARVNRAVFVDGAGLLKEVTRFAGVEVVAHSGATQPPLTAFRASITGSIQGSPPYLCHQRTPSCPYKLCSSPHRSHPTRSSLEPLYERVGQESLARFQTPATHDLQTHAPAGPGSC